VSIQDRINEFCCIDDLIKELTRQKAELAAEILPFVQENTSTTDRYLYGTNGNKVRLFVKNDLKGELLQPLVTPRMWAKITKRVPVSALVKAEIVKGNLDEAVVNSARVESKPSIVKG